jgi:hypothetical protein
MKKLFLLTLAGAIGGAVSAQTPAGTVKVTSPSHVTLQPIDRSHANYGVGNEPIFTGPPASSIRTDGQASWVDRDWYYYLRSTDQFIRCKKVVAA